MFDSVEFAWPWAAGAFLLPWLLRFVVRPASSGGGALRVPDADMLAALEADARAQVRRPLRWLLALACWGLLVVAAMRPLIPGEPVAAPITGRNMMLAVDLSGSMIADDFVVGNQRVNRLVATKAVAGDFLDRREGDRLGLILFGEQAYLQAPLTFDRKTVKALLLEASLGLAGEKTAIGDAIGLAVKLIRDSEADSERQVLVLLTDGANTAGQIDPLRAAGLAANNGLKIYTIGIGALQMDLAPARGRVQRVNPSGELDEATLREIARLTGGVYFRATDTLRLEQIYAELDKLEPASTDAEDLTPMRELYWLAVAASLTLAFLGAVLGLLVGLGQRHFAARAVAS